MPSSPIFRSPIVAVIGGGPAGMMAAGVASKRGLRVILLEKNDMLGKKLLITGGGRCNITNAEFDDRIFLSNLGSEGKFLFSTLSKFNVKSTFDFFESRGLSLMVEDRKRAFPIDQKSASVLNVLLKEIKDIVVKTNISIAGFTLEENTISGIELTSGEIIHGKNILIATGGTSHPETGSTGCIRPARR